MIIFVTMLLLNNENIVSNLINIIRGILNYNLKTILIALTIFMISIIISKLIKDIIIKKLKKIAEKTKTEYDDIIVNVIDKIGWSFYFLIALYITFDFLNIDIIKTVILYILAGYILYYAIKGIGNLIDYGTKLLVEKRLKEERRADISLIELSGKSLKAVIWMIVVLLILSNLGYDISTIIAGFGVGGIAIAIALQSLLSDIFASFSIYFDKPFQVGDYIIFGNEIEGTVKKIGLKSTRIDALQGQEIVISNQKLLNTIINNYERMPRRRVEFSFAVKYETPIDRLKRISEIVKDVIDKVENVKYERAHFYSFGDFGLIYEVVYFVETNEYKIYMDVQEKINIGITESFNNEGIELAYQIIYGELSKDRL